MTQIEDELIDAGESVVIVDNLLTGFKEAVHPKAKVIHSDVVHQH